MGVSVLGTYLVIAIALTSSMAPPSSALWPVAAATGRANKKARGAAHGHDAHEKPGRGHPHRGGHGKGHVPPAGKPGAAKEPAAADQPVPPAKGAAPPAKGAVPGPGGVFVAPTLDLTEAQPSDQADRAKQQVLGKDTGAGGISIDFGGGVQLGGANDTSEAVKFDFGTDDSPMLDLANVGGPSPERLRFERAVRMMSDEDFDKAAQEFRFFLSDKSFAELQPESEYQLAKSLYEMEFFEGAFKAFQVILEKGPTHPRYRKSVEWLFFMSRKLADQTPVLAQLARYRNVTFPKAYRNEYHYLLAKYLFTQADAFEVKRIQDEELARGKRSKDASLDFGAIANAIDSGSGIDFGSASSGLDFGGSGSLDFGGGGGGGGGSLDFGGEATGGGSLDFGASTTPDASTGAVPTNAQEAIKQALELVEQVAKDSGFYPRARYLAGLLHYLGGADQKAVEAFQDVVRLLNPREGEREDAGLREMAFLSLARVHYGYKQFNRSVYYYDLIDRDSENWLTSLFESSWAYFRRGDFEKALGNLLTLHSPFFEGEYFPESQLVKATIYFEACRYPETRSIVDAFISRYTQLMREMMKLVESKEAPELLHGHVVKLQQEAETNEDDVTAQVVSLTLGTPEIRTAATVVEQLQLQQKAFEDQSDTFRTSPLGLELQAQLREAVLERSRQAGEVTRQKFEQEVYKLKGLLAQALRIKIEVTRSERDVLSRKVAGEVGGEEIVAPTPRTVVDDEHVYWPYEGEYWRDELGTYELDFSMCRQALGQR